MTFLSAVQARFLDVTRTGITRCGGFARSESSRKYLFSGLLRCGTCDSRMVIVSGQGKRGYSKYGCPTHWYRGVCQNHLTMRQDRLEAQLLAALERQIWRPDLIQHAVVAFEQEVRRRLAQVRKETNVPELHKRRDQLSKEAGRLVDAITAAGHSAALIERLRSTESRIGDVDAQLHSTRSAESREPTFDALRKFVTDRLASLSDVVQSDPERARLALSAHMPVIVLTPVERETGPIFEVSGSWKLLPEEDAMQMVARDGIEPPTPAFSGLRSTN
jgi:site-specific DNA recombinase